MTRSWKLPGVIFIAVVALMAVAITADAQGPAATDLMAEANARYDREEYAEAAQLYESLVGDGYHDTALYYNLGNAHLGNGDLGRAVLNYLRAREVSPRDPDVGANLELARELTVDRIAAERGSILESVSYAGLRLLNRGELGLLALGMWFVCGVAIGGLLIWRAFPMRAAVRIFAALVAVATLASSLMFLSTLYANPYNSTGVVIVDAVEVVSGPGWQYSEEFIIHSGAQVRMNDSRRGWVEVSLPGGELQGWVPTYALEGVVRADSQVIGTSIR